MSLERIQKVLSQAGYGSRREIEQWIRQGLIVIDGRTAVLGDRISTGEKVTLRGEPVLLHGLADQKIRIIAYHKPAGELVSRKDPENRPLIFDHLPAMKTSRWVSVGRLDFNTSGLLLLTNDGALANKLMHPSSEIEREYAVRVLGEVTNEQIAKMRQGVKLEDGLARFEDIVKAGGEGANHWFHVLLKEGRNREVRRIWESQDITVSRLSRVRYGPVELPRDLKAGRWKDLDMKEFKQLYEAAGLPMPKHIHSRRSKSQRRVRSAKVWPTHKSGQRRKR